MHGNKKSLLLIIAESRTTYDFSCCLDKMEEFGTELVKKIVETKEILGVDEVILSSASPVSINNHSSDWNFGHVEVSWYNQCIIEGCYLDEMGNIKKYFEDCFMGKCFYPEGFTILSKEKGYGNYELIKNNQTGSVKEKTTNYIKELKQTYDINKVILLNDCGYSEPIIDKDRLEKEIGLTIDTFIPTKPFCSQNSYIFEGENSMTVLSSGVSIEGIIDCFSQYNKRISDVKQMNLKNNTKWRLL